MYAQVTTGFHDTRMFATHLQIVVFRYPLGHSCITWKLQCQATLFSAVCDLSQDLIIGSLINVLASEQEEQYV